MGRSGTGSDRGPSRTDELSQEEEEEEEEEKVRVNPWRSVAHCVDHHVDSNLIGRDSVLRRVGRVVDPFPGVAEV